MWPAQISFLHPIPSNILNKKKLKIVIKENVFYVLSMWQYIDWKKEEKTELCFEFNYNDK